MDSERAHSKLTELVNEPNKSTHKKIPNSVDCENPTLHRIPSSGAVSPKRVKIDENYPQNADASFVTPFKAKVWTPEIEQMLLKAPIKEVTYSPFFQGPRYKFTSLFDSLEEQEKSDSSLMSDIIFDFVAPRQVTKMPKPRKHRNKTCAICGQQALVDYVAQACSHRLHNHCKKEHNARKKYKCPICQ